VPYVAFGCRAVLITVFLIAVAGKAASRRSLREFTGSVAAMRVIPQHAAGAAAAMTVSAEMLVIVLAAIPARAAGAAGCAMGAVLSIAFSAAIAVSLRRGNRAPCRCFGRSVTPLGARHLVRNAIVVTVSVLGAAASAGSGTAHVAGAVVAAGAGLFLGLAIASYDEIAELLAPARY
jgi:Methylamine utilisation protein MauE